MIRKHHVEFYMGSQEEKMEGVEDDFPYTALYVELDKYTDRFVPWHWHKTVELFYMESGQLEYYTPQHKIVFPKGSGGLINSNVLHATKNKQGREKNIQLIHMFDLSLIAGVKGGRIEKKYIQPVRQAPQIEIIPLFADNPGEAEILRRIRQTFELSEEKTGIGYEIKLREELSRIWMFLFERIMPRLEQEGQYDEGNDEIKTMMIYVHEHYGEKIRIRDLAEAACISERECFRVFQKYLHTTPYSYIESYRIQEACRMLEEGRDSVTWIGQACGLGSSSHFGKVFREYTKNTPTQYRKKWQDSDRKRR